MEMSVYAIHGFEQVYGGLNGMEEWSLEECNDIEEAIESAIEMSYDVISSYDEITDVLHERAEDYLSYDIEDGNISSEQQRETAFNGYYNECVNEDIAYDVVKLDPSFTLKQYEQMLADGYTYGELIDEFRTEEF